MIYYGSKNCAKLAFYKKSDSSLFCYMPFGNSLQIQVTGDKVEALANGTTIITWQANRKAQATIASNVINSRLLTIMLGATNSTLSTGTMVKFDTGKIGAVTPTFTLSDDVSVGTLSVFITESDGATVKTELSAVASTPTDAQYSISGKVVTCSAGNAGKNILCIYATDETDLDYTVIKANEFAQAFEIKAIGEIKGVDGVTRLQEIHIPNFTAQSNADFTYDSANPSSFTLVGDLSADPVTMELFSFKSM